MTLIANISTTVPEFKHKQQDLAEFMCNLLQYSERDKKKLRMLYTKSGIENRYSVLPDYSSGMEERIFYPKTSNLEPFPSIEYRMQYFNKTALSLCIEAIEKCIQGKINQNQITHLITVSCTGLSAPGIDLDIVQQLNLNASINRTSINFMGCYAAIHALKQADYICKSEAHAVVLIVCIELCTLHFQKTDNMDSITSNLLFGDGAAAALLVSDSYASNNELKGYAIKKFHSQIELSGKLDMAWQVSSTGFLMTLSSYIPQLLEKGIKNLFEKSIEKLNLKKQDISHWAIHPGGRKIVDLIQKELELTAADLESSYRVLKEYGNMSSPTILFVLKDILDTKVDAKKKELTYAVAFGPGLTMESVILENV